MQHKTRNGQPETGNRTKPPPSSSHSGSGGLVCRRGQAAAEYLMTYGWALLMLVAVIALILASGVFNPSYFISEECVLQPDIACTGFQLYRAGGDGDTTLKVRIENRLGYDIRLEDVKVATTDVGAEGRGEWNPQESVGVLGQGRSINLTYVFRGDAQPPEGSVERMGISLTYYSCAREVNRLCEEAAEAKHTVSGRITARVVRG
ncbi:MAG: hypothetical protein AB1657_03975 [Candidatus Micrarchaeota archaeon]